MNATELAEAVMRDLDCSDVYGHRDELTASLARHLGEIDPQAPDPTWTEGPDGYVVAPLVNEGTLNG